MNYQQAVSSNPVLAFADASLRGCGQVWFQNNPLTGAILFAGIFYNSVVLGACALLGTVASTAAAYALGIDKQGIRDGLYGFNGTLTGIAVGFYFNMDPLHYVYLVLASVLSTVFMAALCNMLGKWNLPALTAPFVLTTWLIAFGCYHFSALHPNDLIGPAVLDPNGLQQGGSLSWAACWQGLAKGLGEVMFQDNAVTGLFFLAALLVNSPAACLWGLAGSALGLLTGLVLGADSASLTLGLYGYSAVLTGIALGSGVFFPKTVGNSFYTLLAIVFTAIAQGAITVMLAPVGMPPLTWPFIVVTWVFLLAVPLCRTVGDKQGKPVVEPPAA